MPSPIDPSELTSPAFTAAVMRKILSDPDDKESGSERMRQIGLMMVIHNLHLRSIEATTSRLEEVTGLNRMAIYDITRALEAKGLLQRVNVVNRHNKGRVFKFVIPDGVLDPLAL
jgi:DNA-binding MarR family transcriptional regulator